MRNSTRVGKKVSFLLFLQYFDSPAPLDCSIPWITAVGLPQVYINRGGGRSGVLDRPSKQQLLDNFGSDRFEEVFQLMSDEGNLVPSHRKFEIIPTNKPTYHSRHHTSSR